MVEQNYRIRIKFGEVEIEAEGDKDFVEKHIEEFKKEMPRIAKELPSKEVTQEISGKRVELERLSLAEFYKQKQPKDHNETIVVFAYWLTKREKQQEFTPKAIEACYSQIAITKPANVPQFMKTLASGKKAYLQRGDRRGQYKLSMTGEEFVEKELPRKIEE
jgi:hypothetical protein